MARALRRRIWRSERGQTLTEYLMIAGLLTAIIISLTGIIVPALAEAVVGLVRYVAKNLTSV
jgi:Flp pilus assembly pilin Flp